MTCVPMATMEIQPETLPVEFNCASNACAMKMWIQTRSEIAIEQQANARNVFIIQLDHIVNNVCQVNRRFGAYRQSKRVYSNHNFHIEIGHYGDPLAAPHGNCDQCSCYPQGTEQTELGVSICDQATGTCRCKPNVIGRNCNECQSGYFNIISGNGCESCNCDAIGSFNSSCERFTGQCYCKPGVTG